ncbi:hypothetical protein ACN9MH_08290 [Paenibacillus silvae]|jgi:hypothetical protein|uniref:hypothetical protein n=1 Tax=Paenibacillus TaxID=44249 RepID=UPI001C127E7F|nr:hypothetical protein [Paenibacillus barcinonensis]MBU5356228.1 hypothetical protein [Paenibacillus barcinonensis]
MECLDAYHYFEKGRGPFCNLSSLSLEESETILQQIRENGRTFASQRTADYLAVRRGLEQMAFAKFLAKGGQPVQPYPHYLTLGACPWLESWYMEPEHIIIPWEELPADVVSFTYGDLFPTMRYADDKPYRRQVYTKHEIIEQIQTYGFPQDWNQTGEQGPERYIEVQVWDNRVIDAFR